MLDDTVSASGAITEAEAPSEADWQLQISQVLDGHLQAAGQASAANGPPVGEQLRDLVYTWIDRIVALEGRWIGRWHIKESILTVDFWLSMDGTIPQWAAWNEHDRRDRWLAAWPCTARLITTREQTSFGERYIVTWHSEQGAAVVLSATPDDLGLLEDDPVEAGPWERCVRMTFEAAPTDRWFTVARAKAAAKEAARIARANARTTKANARERRSNSSSEGLSGAGAAVGYLMVSATLVGVIFVWVSGAGMHFLSGLFNQLTQMP